MKLKGSIMKTHCLNKSKAWRQVQIFKTNGLKKRDLEEMRAKDPIEEDIKLIEKKQQLEETISEREDRSRWNNLRFSGFTEKAESAETWEESENSIREFIEGNLEMENKDITIERAHRTGSKINCKKRTIIKFFNYKDKDAVLNQNRH